MALILFVSWQSVRAVGFKTLRTTPSQVDAQVYDPAAWIVSCLGLTLLGLTRFDGVIWCIIVGVFIVCRLMFQGKNDPSRLSLHWRSLLFIAFTCFILPYTAYFAWRVYYFNHFLPNSYACKLSSENYLFYLIKDYLPIALPCLILGLPYFFSRKDCRHSLLWLPSLIYTLLLFSADPTVAHYNRLFLGAFSVFTIIPVLGVQEFFSYFHFKDQRNALATTLVILLFTHLFIPTHSSLAIDTDVKRYQQRNDMRRQIALQLNKEVSKNARVLLADCGMVPFFGRRDIQFIDSLCLNNGDMAAIKTKRLLSMYVKRMHEVIKPDWVVETYYPQLKHGNAFEDELRRIGFFNGYKLVKRYQSHQFVSIKGTFIEQDEDFVYLVYKKKSNKPSRLQVLFLGSVDNSSLEARRPAACLRDVEI